MTPQITYRGMPHSPAMDARIVEHAKRLADLEPRITRCHVTVAEADRHKAKGNLFEVHVDAHVPGHELVATKKAHEDAYVAIDEAFGVVVRQLEGTLARQRGDVKAHRDDRGEQATP